MTITETELSFYRLPLTEPLPVEGHTLTERRGLLLRVKGSGEAEGWGDAAPLPGFSVETLEEATADARRVSTVLPETELPADAPDDFFDRLPASLSPSVRFAVESAVVALCAASGRTSVLDGWDGARDTVPLNGLITDPTVDLGEEVERIRDVGYASVKLKVGREDADVEAACTRRLHELLGPDVNLRLDANRGWTYDDAIAFANALGDVPLSYVEEPLRDPTRLADLVDVTGLPVALDETTRETGPDALTDAAHLEAVVLKPTLLGGIAAARRWARWARTRDVQPVVSASYESGVGLRMLVYLAASLSDAPAGLSTYGHLDTDVLHPRLPIDGAEVSLRELCGSTVDPSALTPIASAR